ncbi:MAG: hypothetical protein AAFQ34_06490 [Pseudomonadota bacterium]
MTTQQQTELWKTPGPWLGMILGLGSPATMFAFNRGGWIAGLALVAILAALAVVVVRRLKGEHVARIYGSPALVRYNTRFMLAMAGYVLGMLIAISIHNSGMPAGPLAYTVPLLPTLPALAMIVVMGRYLVEETDEYLRHRASLSAIIGLGVVLVLGTVWGFLETFGLVPHIWAWWVVPAWAIGLGIGQGLLSRSERKAENASAEDEA